MPTLFLFPIFVCIAGALWMYSRPYVSSQKKKKIVTMLLAVAAVAFAVAQPVEHPDFYALSVALAAANCFLQV
jgi:putative effector of murein hydrolase